MVDFRQIITFGACCLAAACCSTSTSPHTEFVSARDLNKLCDYSKTDVPPEWCPEDVQALRALLASSGNVHAAAGDMAIPFLPWPPPRPAVFAPLRGRISVEGAYGQVAERIVNRLHVRGYEDLLFYEVPGGFALVTELERFEADGDPAVRGRFQRGKLGSRNVLEIASHILFGEEGHFRVFVFVVSSEPFQPATYPAGELDVERWARQGAFALPAPIAVRKTSKATSVTLLAYEFLETRGRQVQLQATMKSAPREDHLRWLGLRP